MKLKTLLFCCTLLPLQAQVKSTSKPAPSTQSAAMEAMQKSIALQQMSVQKQAPPEVSKSSFFQLPPPATMGATVAMPPPISAGLSPMMPPRFNCDPLPASQIDSLVGSAAEREDLDPDLIRGVIRQESAFIPCAVSSKGAQGLMQLMPATAAELGVMNPFNPVQNVDGGAKLLKQLLNRYGGDLSKALSAYNAGPSRVDAVTGIPQIPETQNYVQQILSLLPGRQ